jgi:hypothetical protein
MSLQVRLHPLGSSEAALQRQWASAEPARTVDRSLIAILRTVPEDPDAVAEIGPLRPGGPSETQALTAAWADAQLVADMTWLGLAVGVRIVLVPDRGRWFADTLVIRTGARLRTGRGNANPAAALQAIRRSYAATLGVTSAGSRDPRAVPPLWLVPSTYRPTGRRALAAVLGSGSGLADRHGRRPSAVPGTPRLSPRPPDEGER